MLLFFSYIPNITCAVPWAWVQTAAQAPGETEVPPSAGEMDAPGIAAQEPGAIEVHIAVPAPGATGAGIAAHARDAIEVDTEAQARDAIEVHIAAKEPDATEAGIAAQEPFAIAARSAMPVPGAFRVEWRERAELRAAHRVLCEFPAGRLARYACLFARLPPR